MLQRFAKYFLLPVSVSVAVASCQQPPSATTPPPATPVAAAPKSTPSEAPKPPEAPKPSESAKPSEAPKPPEAPKSSEAPAAGSDNAKKIVDLIQEKPEYKEMYELTGGDKYVKEAEKVTCQSLDAGMPLPDLLNLLEKEFDKPTSSGKTIPPAMLNKLKEYTGALIGASVIVSCPQHKAKLQAL